MSNDFRVKTVIKGKELKDRILLKVLKEDLNMQGFQYQLGLNVDIQPLALKGPCEAGLYFCDIKNVCQYLDYGEKLAIITIPENEDVYVDYEKYRTHSLVIEKVLPLFELSTWKYLLQNGADITACHNEAIICVAERGHLDIVKYLHENGANITDYDNLALRLAAQNGHFEVVKYFHQNGADITVDDNYAIIYAAKYGYLEVVKYLHENGADITACNNLAIRWASTKKHLDVVEYLKKNGATL